MLTFAALPRAHTGVDKPWEEIAREDHALYTQLDAQRESVDYDAPYERDQEGHLWGFRVLVWTHTSGFPTTRGVDTTLDDGRVTIVQLAAYQTSDSHTGIPYSLNFGKESLHEITGSFCQIPKQTEVPWDTNYQQVETSWTLMQFEAGQNYMDG